MKITINLPLKKLSRKSGSDQLKEKADAVRDWYRATPHQNPIRSLFQAISSRDISQIVEAKHEGASFQLLGEIAGFGTSQAANEVGETRIFQFAQEHLREAKRLASTGNIEAGLHFLKSHYPNNFTGHENIIRRGLLPTRSNLLGLGIELFSGTILGTVLGDLVPAGHLQHSIQNSANYVVGTLFRGGMQSFQSLNRGKVSRACAEGIPLTLVHTVVSFGMRSFHQAVQQNLGIHLPGVHIAEDFVSIAVYDLLKVRGLRLYARAPIAVTIGTAALLGATLALYQYGERRSHA